MPVPNINTRQTAKGTPGTGGGRTVVYRDTRGRTWDAKVAAAGTGNTLTLTLQSRRWGMTGLSRIVADVPRATGMKQTNVYFNAWGA
jgi:hypothetical protein